MLICLRKETFDEYEKILIFSGIQVCSSIYLSPAAS